MEKDLSVLKKKLSTYKSDGGRIKNIDDDLLLEILHYWEEWTGTAKNFYSSIGSSYKQMGPIIGRAKKLKRERGATAIDFKPLGIIESNSNNRPKDASSPIILSLKKGKTIRFYCMDHLLEFLHRYKEAIPQKEEKSEAA